MGRPRAQDLSASRLKWVIAFLVAWGVLVAFRLYWIQIHLHSYYQDRALRQHFVQKNIDPIRGEIRDRNDEVLATSLPSESLYVTPPVFYPSYSRKKRADGETETHWGEPDMVFANQYAKLVAGVLDRPEAFVIDRFLRKSSWFLVERQLSPLKVAALKEVNKEILREVNKEITDKSDQKGKSRQVRRLQRKEPALVFIPEYRRHYPRNSLACQVLGFVNDDGQGQLGVEKAYETMLAGQTGVINAPKDGLNNYSILKESYIEVPVNGSRLQLTIDSTIQQIVEDVLAETVSKSRPITAHCVVVEPNTGEILAMAGTPVFDPNTSTPNKFRGRLDSDFSNAERQELRAWRSTQQAARRLHPLEDSYEPGSTMKIFTAAMALEERKVRIGESIDCMGGQWLYAPNVPPITDSHRYGLLPFEQVLWQSSNVGTAKIGMRIRPAEFYKYLKEFGFGDPTLNFAGETRGSVPAPVAWSTPTQYTLSYGYGMSASPLQVLMAGCAIANGGKLMKPQLIKAVYNDKGILLKAYEPEIRFQVISEETSGLMRDVLKGVITEGTAKKARLDEVEAFGKTGTSRKVINGKYDLKRHYASFMGFFPADKPKYGILVMLDEPAGDVTGGDVAAPAFKKIGDSILRYTSSAPQTVQSENLRLTLQDWPLNGGDEAAIHVQKGRTPDLIGLELRNAIQRVILAGGTIQTKVEKTSGVGAYKVVSQTPEPGKPLPSDQAVTVTLRSP